MGTIWLQGRRRHKVCCAQQDCFDLDGTDPITEIWTDPPTMTYELRSDRHGGGDVLFSGAGTTFPPAVMASSVTVAGA